MHPEKKKKRIGETRTIPLCVLQARSTQAAVNKLNEYLSSSLQRWSRDRYRRFRVTVRHLPRFARRLRLLLLLLPSRR